MDLYFFLGFTITSTAAAREGFKRSANADDVTSRKPTMSWSAGAQG